MFSRPSSLAEYAEALASGNPEGWTLSEFLDTFYGTKPEELEKLISCEPVLLSGKIVNGEFVDAYLAGTAEYLSWHHDLPCPSWTSDPRRFSKVPWFATEIKGLQLFWPWRALRHFAGGIFSSPSMPCPVHEESSCNDCEKLTQ